VNFDQERLLRQVILYFTHAVADRGSSLPKIKLVKLLYLVDLAGWHERGTPVTGLDWVFFHYGPYAPSLEPLLDRYEGQYFERRKLSRQATQRLVGEASQLGRATVPTENEVVFLFIPLANLPDEPVEDSLVAGLAERVAQRWAGSATEDLLRFVYATQPIAKGRRYEPIDWNLQPRDSGTSRGDGSRPGERHAPDRTCPERPSGDAARKVKYSNGAGVQWWKWWTAAFKQLLLHRNRRGTVGPPLVQTRNR